MPFLHLNLLLAKGPRGQVTEPDIGIHEKGLPFVTPWPLAKQSAIFSFQQCIWLFMNKIPALWTDGVCQYHHWRQWFIHEEITSSSPWLLTNPHHRRCHWRYHHHHHHHLLHATCEYKCVLVSCSQWSSLTSPPDLLVVLHGLWLFGPWQLLSIPSKASYSKWIQARCKDKLKTAGPWKMKRFLEENKHKNQKNG